MRELIGDRRSAAWRFVPLALAVCVVLPRLISPQFGLLDDGFTLATGRAVAGHWWNVLRLIPETGRFFPAHWLAYSVLVAALGARPLAFFAVNTLLLASVLAMLMRLVVLGGGGRAHAVIAAVLFALSGPALEAWYTLSKPEPLQLVWMGISLLGTAASVAQRTPARRAGVAALAGCAVLLADATKETGLALVPISLGWLAIEQWWMRERGAALSFARTYAVLALAAAVVFGALRWHFAPLGLAEGWYTRAYAPDLRMLGGAALRIGVWLARDFAYLVPVAVLACAAIGGSTARRRLVAYASVWMAAWLAVYAPWPVTFEYYLAPFALGAAVVAAVAIGDAAGRLRERGLSQIAAIGVTAVLAMAGLSWAATVVNGVADARVQLAVDRANAGLIAFLATLPPRSRVAVNTPWLDEYVLELPRHLAELNGRSDIAVEHLPRARRDAPRTAELFVATPVIANPPAPTVRIPFDEAGARRVNAALDTVPEGRGRLVYRTAERRRLVEVGLQRLLCPIAASAPAARPYCTPDQRLIRVLPFSYGWDVRRVEPEERDPTLPRRARESDGSG